MDKFLRPCVAEMLGTFLWCFIAAGVICTDFVAPKGGIGPVGIALAQGLIVAVAVSATMAVSGGHLNPAVTVAHYVLGRIDTPQMVYYVASQFIGALAAGFFLTVIFGGGAATTNPNIALGTPHMHAVREIFQSGPWWQVQAVAGVIEMVLSFILVFAVFGTTVDARAPRIGGLGVGLSVVGCALVGGPFTGACLNPARYFGTGLWDAGMNANGFQRLADMHVYIVGPVIGAIIAAWVYTKFVLPPEPAEHAHHHGEHAK